MYNLYRCVTEHLLSLCLQVRDKLIGLGTKRGDMVERWESRWEHLQLSTYFVADALFANFFFFCLKQNYHLYTCTYYVHCTSRNGQLSFRFLFYRKNR